MKSVMEAKAILYDDDQLEVKVIQVATRTVFDERQVRQLANAIADLITGMLGDDTPPDGARVANHFKFSTH